MKSYAFQTWDVFTRERFAGNQLAVIFDADDLTAEQMQTVTREFNFAESVFILSPKDPNNAARVRIFTPGYEVPFAGHPTVGASIAVAKARSLDQKLCLELKSGVFSIELDQTGDAPYAAFLNPNIPAEGRAAPPARDIETALSLPSGSLNRTVHAPRIVGAGVDFLYVNAAIDDVRAAKLNMQAFDALALRQEVGVLLYAKGGDLPGTDFHVRMFAPDAGVVEDAATGAAAAALPGQLLLAGDLGEGTQEFLIEQGVEMERPSYISVKTKTEKRKLTQVHIGGFATLVTDGTIRI